MKHFFHKRVMRLIAGGWGGRGEVKIHPTIGIKTQSGSRYSYTLSSTSVLDGVGGQSHTPTTLPPGKGPGTHCTGGLVGPRVGLDRCGTISPPTRFDSRTVQPVASRYTVFAITCRWSRGKGEARLRFA